MGTFLNIKPFERFIIERAGKVYENDESGAVTPKPDIFTDAEWADFQVDHTIIIGADLTKAEFQGDFSRAELMGCNLSEVKMENVDFKGANMSNVTGLGSTQPNGEGVPTFYTCDWRGANFTGVDFNFLEPKYIDNPTEFFDGCQGVDIAGIGEFVDTRKSLGQMFGGRFAAMRKP